MVAPPVPASAPTPARPDDELGPFGPDPELMVNAEGDKKALRHAKTIAARDRRAASSADG